METMNDIFFGSFVNIQKFHNDDSFHLFVKVPYC